MTSLSSRPHAGSGAESQASWPLVRLCCVVFLSFLTISMPLPVIPLYVREILGFGDVLVGAAVGIQFLATVSTRKYAGAESDQRGPRVCLRKGLIACAMAGAFYLVSAFLPAPPVVKLAVLMAGRLMLGVGESLTLTAILAWGLALAGPGRAGRAMAWFGLSMYAALAAGAPFGLWLSTLYGMEGLSVAVMLAPLAALPFYLAVPVVPVRPGARVPFLSVVRMIWRPGVALGLQGVGFAAIGAFVALYFAREGWSGAGLALSAFGLAFMAARVFCGGLPDRHGGARVALWFFVIEAAGQALLWLAPGQAAAMAGAAVTGFGCSLIFPSLGVEAVRLTPPECRGTALGAFAAFQDVAYALTGPLTGLAAGSFGYRSVYLIGMAAAVTGFLMALPLTGRAVSAAREQPAD